MRHPVVLSAAKDPSSLAQRARDASESLSMTDWRDAVRSVCRGNAIPQFPAGFTLLTTYTLSWKSKFCAPAPEPATL